MILSKDGNPYRLAANTPSKRPEDRPSIDELLEAVEELVRARPPMRPTKREGAQALAQGHRVQRDYECDFDEIAIGVLEERGQEQDVGGGDLLAERAEHRGGKWRLVVAPDDDVVADLVVPRSGLIAPADATQAEAGVVARLHLEKVGAKLTVLSKEQADYLGVPVEGPYKDDSYRY